jgi:predicted RNA-binding Zn-ribbon protein involved in translation (DUF1610 family)
MGANNGTGWPNHFRCSNCRKTRRYYQCGYVNDVTLTGKTKPYKGGNKGVRGSSTHFQYTCLTCGHTGWSRHNDLERKRRTT